MLLFDLRRRNYSNGVPFALTSYKQKISLSYFLVICSLGIYRGRHLVRENTVWRIHAVAGTFLMAGFAALQAVAGTFLMAGFAALQAVAGTFLMAGFAALQAVAVAGTFLM